LIFDLKILSLYAFLVVFYVICARWSSKQEGDAEIAELDIARPDNAAPYRRGGHRNTGQRETWKRGARSNRGVRAQRSRVVIDGYLCMLSIRFLRICSS